MISDQQEELLGVSRERRETSVPGPADYPARGGANLRQVPVAVSVDLQASGKANSTAPQIIEYRALVHGGLPTRHGGGVVGEAGLRCGSRVKYELPGRGDVQ